MALAIDPLIRLAGISKIFHTEDVETHALSRHRSRHPGRGIRRGLRPSGCGKTSLLSILGLLDSPSEGSYVLAGRAGVDPLRRAAGAGSGPRRSASSSRPSTSSATSPSSRTWSCRSISGPARRASAGRRARGARAGRAAAPDPPLPGPALGRPAAARRRGARRRRQAARAAGRRADRQPRLQQRRRGDGPARRAARGGATIVIVTHDPRYLREAQRTVYLFDGRLVPGATSNREVA